MLELFQEFLELQENSGHLDYEEYQERYDELSGRLQAKLKLADKGIEELDDSVDFMQTFEETPESFGEEGLERLRVKENLLVEFSNY